MRCFLFFLCFFPLCLFADDGAFVLLPVEKIHQGDYFATGSNIEIAGQVTGDVYVFGSHILISGQVDGDVIASAGTVDISGVVKGNLRVAGGQVEIGGVIGARATIFGGHIKVTSQSDIGQGALITGGVVEFSGKISQNLTLTASTAQLSGTVGGNVKAYVEQLRLKAKSVIGGNIVYTSGEQIVIDSGAKVGGTITYHASSVHQFFRGKWKEGVIVGTKLTAILMNFIFSFVIGWLFIRWSPERLRYAEQVLATHPWRAFFLGILIAVLLPIACLLLFITILGFPLALALVVISLIGFYTAKIIPILYYANRLFARRGRRRNSLWILLLGLLVFFMLNQVPFLGVFLSIVFTLLGLGSVFLGKISKSQHVQDT